MPLSLAIRKIADALHHEEFNKNGSSVNTKNRGQDEVYLSDLVSKE
jgi:hypothetical protein